MVPEGLTCSHFPYSPTEVLSAYWLLGQSDYARTVLDSMGDLAGQEVLDIGGGCGFLSELAAQAGALTVRMVDISDGMLRVARQRCGYVDVPVTLSRQDARRLAFAPDSFDLVVCQLVLHTLQQPEQASAEAHRVTRPGGRFVAIEPVESATVFASADWAFAAGASEFASNYVALTRSCGFEFDLGLKLPSLMAESGWTVKSVEGFLHTHWCPPEERGELDDPGQIMHTWKRKLALAARLADQATAAAELPVFTMRYPSDLLTTLSWVLVVGEK